MNYTELRKANILLKEIGNINDLLQAMKERSKSIRISTNYCFGSMDFNPDVSFSDKHKDKISEVIKEIRDDMVGELKLLGVVEDK